jgi:hypothetical protein
MRASNSLAVAMVFITGVAYGRCVGRTRLGFELTMVVLGMALFALTIRWADMLLFFNRYQRCECAGNVK